VFHQKGGFDVIIANPPYVRADSGPEHLAFRKKLEESKTYKTLYEKWDLMVPFIERGLNITNPRGDLIYIVSNAICTSKYAFKLLNLILDKYFTRSIDYFEDMTVFEAGVNPVVLHVGKNEGNGKTKKITHRSFFENRVNVIEIASKKFKSLGRNAFRKEYNPLTLKAQVVDLGDICYVSYGLRPNSDERLWKGDFTTKDVVSTKKSRIFCKPFVEGKDLESYRIKRLRYLEWDTDRVPSKIARQTFPELYLPPKIIRGRMNPGVYDCTETVCSANAIVIKRLHDLEGINNRSIQNFFKKHDKNRKDLQELSKDFDLKYLLSILNSRYGFYHLNNIRRHKQKNYFYPDDLKKLPIRKVSLEGQKPFVDIVDRILTITKNDDYLQNPDKQVQVKEYERQIDQMVYELYDLTEEEIRIVEGEAK
jgi:adenine-specific DNA-methyltransferase